MISINKFLKEFLPIFITQFFSSNPLMAKFFDLIFHQNEVTIHNNYVLQEFQIFPYNSLFIIYSNCISPYPATITYKLTSQ